ncbi:hypothetical protein [Halorubrum ezzemoulense]|uniref:hypothetical protein n=1 Tax=Halorubrum ezzemoulense TaxID=337243 RepID=UPI0011322E79|nr:hypothetical protein [Halorubrum ezzemoulense]
MLVKTYRSRPRCRRAATGRSERSRSELGLDLSLVDRVEKCPWVPGVLVIVERELEVATLDGVDLCVSARW